MDEKVYWIWLQKCLGFGSHKIRTVRLLYKNIIDFYKATSQDLRMCGCFNKKEIDHLDNKSLDDSYNTIKKCNSLGYAIITINSEEYPFLLKNIPNPPAVLYVLGDTSALKAKNNIAVVGTRKATSYGMRMAYDMGAELAKNGIVVVSGGAVGIDAAAHEGVLSAQGKAVAVLGCGINYPYLRSNLTLRREILRNGALVSEYPPDWPSLNYNFPIRNRIISGLSKATVVVEASVKSGSLITANCANDQNRDVFVMPADINFEQGGGVCALIEDGVRVVKNAQDILNEYSFKNDIIKSRENKPEEKREEPNDSKKKPLPDFKLTELEIKIYNLIKDQKIGIDELSVLSDVEVRELFSILTRLEIYGLVEPCSGRTYKRK